MVKFPHPTQVPRGEARDIRVRIVQILRRSDSGAFLRPAADQPANLTVQFHLRQICRHQGVQRREHGAVVNRFSDVHSASPFRRGHACFIKAKKNAAAHRTFLYLECSKYLYDLLPEQDMLCCQDTVAVMR